MLLSGCVFVTRIVLLCIDFCFFFFFKQKTAYEMRISDWSSDVCSSDLIVYRIATLGPVTAEALDDLEALIMRRGTATVAGNAPQRGGTTEAAAIMNNVRKVNEQRIIKQIGKRDKTVAQTIEEIGRAHV